MKEGQEKASIELEKMREGQEHMLSIIQSIAQQDFLQHRLERHVANDNENNHEGPTITETNLSSLDAIDSNEECAHGLPAPDKEQETKEEINGIG